MTLIRVLVTALAALCVGAVVWGWTFAGWPNDAEDAVNLVLTHVLAVVAVAAAVFVWRWEW